MNKKQIKSRAGVALLVVLFVIMAITVLSLGFLARSDVELACGANMELHAQMDYLAESGLEHAKGLILNPYDINAAYWAGAQGQQLIAGSDEYYDVSVAKLGELNYKVNSIAYKLRGGQQVGRSSLEAEVRLDPCIGFYVLGATNIRQWVTINGDVFCGGNLDNSGAIVGDAFAAGSIAGGNIAGQKYANVPSPPVAWPGLGVGNFSSTYFVYGSQHSVGQIAIGDYNDVFWGPNAGNPKGVYFCNGDLRLSGNAVVNGTLVVSGDLLINGLGNSVTAVKNFPALLVDNRLILESGARLEANGLVQVNSNVVVKAGASNVWLDVFGALCVGGSGIGAMMSNNITVNITAAPSIASIQTWASPGVPVRWSPAGGAFYRSIKRK